MSGTVAAPRLPRQSSVVVGRTRSEPAGLVDRLAKELLADAAETMSRLQVEAALRESLRDLAGSVSPESLPEMAARLAGVRIGIRPGADSRP